MGPWIRDRNCFSTRFKVNRARRKEFISTFLKLCETAKGYYERGCTFAFQGWARDPNEFVVFASWDEAVAAELRKNPDFQRYNAELLDCCDEPMLMEQFSGMDADRTIFETHPAGESRVHPRGKEHRVIFL